MMSSKNDLQHPLRVVLYTRRGCHLCDEARELLLAQAITPELVDIDEEPELEQRFGCMVPVVEIDGRVRFRGRVVPVLLRRLIWNRRQR